MAVAKTTTVAAVARKRPARKPFPEHLPRERGDSTGSEPGTQFGTRPARIPG
jgi:Transposase C of IS166 homeodomain